MALLSAEHLAGPGYIILNILRGMNIITLMSVVASSVVMLVKTFVVSKFFFFDATSHVITGITGLFLIVSECSIFRGYYARNWPLLSPAHGFVALGCAMMVLGLNMLGNMNKEATSQKSLGLPFWRLLLASGILAVVIGFFNVVASYVFRDKSRHITARRVRSHGAITLSENGDIEAYAADTKAPMSVTTHYTGSASSRIGTPPIRTGTPPVNMGSPQPQMTSPQKQSHFSQFNFSGLRNARQSFLPSYHSRMFGHSRSSSTYSRSTSGESKFKAFRKNKRDSSPPPMPLEISAPLNVNPQFAHLVKPNLAHHPSQRRPETDGLGFDKI